MFILQILIVIFLIIFIMLIILFMYGASKLNKSQDAKKPNSLNVKKGKKQ